MIDSISLRSMAERYLRLAKATTDKTEKAKWLDYAAIYADLSEQVERCERDEALITRNQFGGQRGKRLTQAE